MICGNCSAEFNDDMRFCPKCGAAKSENFYQGEAKQTDEKPFFVEAAYDEVEEDAHEQTYPPYRPASFDMNASGKTDSRNQNTQNAQGAYYEPSRQVRYAPEKRTFDDESVKKFLIGFSVVAVAVVVLVIALVLQATS